MNRFAVIDMGSNGIRCLVVQAGEDGPPRVIDGVREAVRLGSPAFQTGRIGPEASRGAVEAFGMLRRLIDSHAVANVRAVATSAVREARDGAALVQRIAAETGIRVQIIDAAEEARLIRRAVASRLDLRSGRVAIVDVGGGSVEIVVLADGEVIRTESFAMGAVRLLQAPTGAEAGADPLKLLEKRVEAMRARVRTTFGSEPADLYVATGGSIEVLADLAGEPAPSPPSLDDGTRMILLSRLRETVADLASRSYLERVRDLGLREDRADVIVPAAIIYLKLGEAFGTDRAFVPGVGLKEGLVLEMIDELE